MNNVLNTKNRVFRRRYLKWLIDKCWDPDRYSQLYLHLFNIDYKHINEYDSNRASDGEYLRFLYGEEVGLTSDTVIRNLEFSPCTILELIVALAIRLETIFYTDKPTDNRTDLWIKDMIESLGLSRFDNDRFDRDEVDERIYRFLNAEFDEYGKGGLFTLNTPNPNIRSFDIWKIANLKLNEIRTNNKET